MNIWHIIYSALITHTVLSILCGLLKFAVLQDKVNKHIEMTNAEQTVLEMLRSYANMGWIFVVIILVSMVFLFFLNFCTFRYMKFLLNPYGIDTKNTNND